MYNSWSYFQKVQTLLPTSLCHIRPLTFFTCSGHYLSILYILYPYIFSAPAPASFAGLVYGVLFGITAGFWIFVYDPSDYKPLQIRRRSPKCDDSLKLTYQTYYLTDFANHGPLLVMFSAIAYSAGEDAFSLDNAWMPTAWGLTWFAFIWFPFQLLGGDPLYEDLARSKPLAHKITVIVKMIVITTAGYFFGMAFNWRICEGVLAMLKVVNLEF